MTGIKRIAQLSALLGALLVSGWACPSGVGWYPLSFNWEKYEKDLPQVRKSVEICRRNSDSYGISYCGYLEYQNRLDYALALVNDSEAFSFSVEGVPTDKAELARLRELYADRYEVADARTLGVDEMIGWPVLKEVFELASDDGIRKYLLLFKEGRSEWGADIQDGCKDGVCELCDWRCNEVYVLLRPHEVADFERQLRKFLSENHAWDPPYFSEEAQGLLNVLSEAAKSKRALYFYAHD